MALTSKILLLQCQQFIKEKKKIKAGGLYTSVKSMFRGYNQSTAAKFRPALTMQRDALGNKTKTDKVWPWWYMAIVDPIIWETERGGSLQVPGQPELPSKKQFQ